MELASVPVAREQVTSGIRATARLEIAPVVLSATGREPAASAKAVARNRLRHRIMTRSELCSGLARFAMLP